MKLLYSLLFTVLSACAFSQIGQEITHNSIRYKIISGSTLEVIANSPQYSGFIEIPEEVEHNGTSFTVTSIGEDAFKNSSITNIELPKTITQITKGAFWGCSDLYSFYIDHQNLSYRTIDGVLYSYDASLLIQCPALKENITISEYTTAIEEGAFAYCTNITSITIPNHITSIPSRAFYNCNKLQTVVFSENLQTIGEYAFYNCHALSSVSFPVSLTNIDDYAFSACSGIHTLEFKGTTPPTLGIDVFESIQNGTSIYVPESSVSVYAQDSFWSSYSVISNTFLSVSNTALNVKIYPNPFTNQIIIEHTSSCYEYIFTLYSIQGTEIIQEVTSGTHVQNLDFLPSGTYLYTISCRETSQRGVLVKN